MPPMGAPPREAVLFVPPHLTGMIIGKGGVVINSLRQEAGEMECKIDLQQNRPPEGDGSAKIIVTGANGKDVMVSEFCVCVCVCVCVFVLACMYKNVRTCTHVNTHTRIYERTCIHTTPIHLHIQAHEFTHARIYR